MDIKRITSGIIVFVALIILLLIPNKPITDILLAVITIVAIDEYLKAISKICNPVKWLAYASCIIVAIVNFIPQEYLLKVVMFSMPTIILLLFVQVVATDMKITFKDIAYTFLGIAYIPGFMVFLSLTDGLENGKALLGYIFLISWGTDVFAYAIGKRIGKHTFSKVSPKKSIEGCIAGTIGAVLVAIIYTLILDKICGIQFSYKLISIFAIILSFVGQIGDFSASSIKRYVDIKDYGSLLPGHGGMLDRIDSVIFTAPFAYMLFTLL